jgi:hypothetical protein
MQSFTDHLDGIASCAAMDLSSRDWHIKALIPPEAGWYFIRTTAPVSALQLQARPNATYTQKSGKTVKVAHYDIAMRAGRYAADLKDYWNVSEVYSGMASDLQSRAREHTFADPGTAALALSLYPDLHEYEWLFCYITLTRFNGKFSCPRMMLALGEQIWRARNGWPLLSAA